MSDSLTTKVDRSYLDDATRADAARYLVRKGYGDLLVILGLAVETQARDDCPVCGKPVPLSGVCRRGVRCREAVMERGEDA